MSSSKGGAMPASEKPGDLISEWERTPNRDAYVSTFIERAHTAGKLEGIEQEREACAKTCEQVGTEAARKHSTPLLDIQCAYAIRARQ